MNTKEMLPTEPIEIRFHSVSGRRVWQLLVTEAKGVLHYRLESVPRGNYGFSLGYLSSTTTERLPMKAVQGWQHEVVMWLQSLNYELEEIR